MDALIDFWVSSNGLVVETDVHTEEDQEHLHILDAQREIHPSSHVPSPVSTNVTPASDLLPTQVNERAHISMVDMYEQKSNEYQGFLIYQDLFSRYVVLKPLKELSNAEIVGKLIDIFFLIGAPKILQSDQGREFTENLVQTLRNGTPALNIIYGNMLKHTENYRDYRMLVKLWQEKHPAISWHEGLNFIQIRENTSIISDNKSGKSAKTPAQIFFESNRAGDLMQLSENEQCLGGLCTEEKLAPEAVETNLALIFRGTHEKIVDDVPNVNEKTNEADIQESSSVTAQSLHQILDDNGIKENIDNSNLPSAQNKVFIGKQKAVKKVKKFPASNTGVFECQFCNRTFRKKNYLTVHMKTHNWILEEEEKESANGGDLFANLKPDPSLSNFKQVLVNIRKTKIQFNRDMIKYAQYQMNLCNRNFKEANTPMVLSSSPIIVPASYKCNHCDAWFTEKCNLRDHVNVDHPRTSMYFYFICRKNFIQRSDYYAHMDSHNHENLLFR